MNFKNNKSILNKNLFIYVKNLCFVIVFLMMLALVSGCEKVIKVTDINLDTDDVTVEVGDVVNVFATVLPTDATNKVVIWTSSDPLVATVDEGVVSTLSVGETIITAKIDKIEASFKVTVILEKVTISFANTSLDNIEINKNSKLSVPEEPVKEGYTFDNWYIDSEFNTLYDFDNEVTENLTLYARFIKNSFDVVFANTSLEIQQVDSGSKLLKPEDPEKEGYTFDNWYIDSEFNTLYDFDSLVTEDLTIYARFSVKVYTVVFADTDIDDVLVEHNQKVARPEDPVKEGYIFSGWRESLSPYNFYNFDSLVVSDITLNPVFTEITEFIVSFENIAMEDIVVNKGEKLSELEDPIKEGFTFGGWFSDSEFNTLYDFDLVLTNHLTLYAKWDEITYTVTLISYDDVILDSLKIKEGENLSTINEYNRDGYIFVDWYIDSSFAVKARLSNPVIEDLTLYAKWEARTDVAYTINHYLYDVDSDEYLIEETINYTGTTGETVFAEFKEYPGLMSEYAVYSGVVKGDGSLVINIRYVEFDGDIIYHLDGGNFTYPNREAMALDFLADYNEATSSAITLAELEAYGNWSPLNMHIMLFTEPYRTKWMWMIDYLGQVGSTTNKSACKLLKTASSLAAFTSSSDNNKYAVEYEVRAFILGIKYTKNANWMSSDYSVYDIGNGFWNLFVQYNEQTKYTTDGSDVELAYKVYKEGFLFKGWYFEEDFVNRATASVNRGCDLYAKWEPDNPLTEIIITNPVTEITKLETHQLILDFVPGDAFSKQVKYSSSDQTILLVSEDGLITAVNSGTAIITVKSATSDVSISITINVPVESNIVVDVSSDYNGVLNVSEEFSLIVSKYGVYSSEEIEFASSNTDIITVTDNGVVKGISEGSALIMISAKSFGSIFMSLDVTVKNLEETSDIDKLFKLLVDANQPVVDKINASLYYDNFSSYQQYYDATYGSVNLFLFDDLRLDRETYAVTPSIGNNTSGVRSSTEFIAVHDTANLNGGLAGHGNYWLTASTSIHFTVGDYGVIGNLPEEYVGYHAGDGTSSTFTWTDTSVVSNGSKPIIDISSDGYYTFNGEKSSVKAPTGNSGQILDSSYFTSLGPVWKIGENNNYFIGTTYFTTSQVSRGVIANHGGNNNSIGIEMCVNTTGEIVDTWQRNAKLVGMLLNKYGLDLTRVQQHNSFSGKNCPQSLRMSNYWDKFMEMVALELEIQSNYSEAIISIVSNNPDLISNTGRVIGMPVVDTAASYTLTVKLGEETRSIDLGVIIPGTASWKQLNGYYSTK
ncbi:MAG: InlB B-repeat-containing protein [Bacilli bacterium]|jgi:uncharacterized repeat protein (TIGR02543 family)